MIKLVITDLDDTLLDAHSKISDENIQAIKYLKEKGVRFGIASGRVKFVIKKIAIEHNILDLVDIMIGTNGVEISDKEIIKDSSENYMHKDILLEIYNQFKHFDVVLALHEGKNMIANKMSDFALIDRDANGYTMMIEPDFEKVLTRNFSRMVFIGESEILEEISNEMEKIEDIKYSFFKSYHSFLETVTKDMSKGKTLELYCKSHNIDMKDVLAIGDNNNDIEMVKASGYGIAVSNATDQLKEHADYITGSNIENGFAQAIYKFIK